MKVGDKYIHQVSFSQEDVVKFAELTHDTNPIHLDEDYASKTVFLKPIVPGYLSGAVFSKVFGTLFPGVGTIYLYQEMKFRKPVFVNEDYEAKFDVIEINIAKHKAVVFCQLINSLGEGCIEGKAVIINPEKIF